MCCCIISSLRYKEMSCTTHYFFFSSRRRHTRSLRDWSSDVCSSDLQSLRRCPQRGRLRPDLLRQQRPALGAAHVRRSEEHTSELQSRRDLVCRLLLEKKNNKNNSAATRNPCNHIANYIFVNSAIVTF